MLPKTLWGRLYRILVASGALLALTLTVLTIHNLSPVSDPVTPLGFLDRLSLLVGIHKRSAVVVVDVALFSVTVYSYIFQRHVADDSFHVAHEAKEHILPGLFRAENDSQLEERLDELLAAIARQLPEDCLVEVAGSVDVAQGDDDPRKTPVVARISQDTVESVPRDELRRVVAALSEALSRHLLFDPATSVGTLGREEEKVLQWFAVNLLSHTLLPDQSVARTAVIVDVGERDVEVTLPVGSGQRVPEAKKRVVAESRLSAFERSIRLVTLRYPGLGLYTSRFELFRRSLGNESASAPSREEVDVHNECMNPISQSSWSWFGRRFRVSGKEHPDFELVRERNGPFAGKKINRPVANYDQCHASAVDYLRERLAPAESSTLRSLLRGRRVFMEGLLLEKCMERGLTLPYRGGHVRMKSFVDSLHHACKVPNTDQPFGCVDMMYLGTLVDRMLGLKQGSILYSSCDLDGMTGEWPLAAAFYVYENGL